MDRRLAAFIGIVLVLVVLVVVYVNRVALKAAGIQAIEESQKVAAEQQLANWELFFRDAMKNLDTEIRAQEGRLTDARLTLARDKAQMSRDQGLAEKYGKVLDEFSAKVKNAGNAGVNAHGRTYTPDEAQAQLREFAGAVVDQQNKVAALTERVTVEETQIKQIEEALRVARQQMARLKDRGEEMVRERSLAELKAVSIEIASAVSGLDPNAPLTGAMKHVNDLLVQMQSHIDGVTAVSEVTVQTSTGDAKVVTIQQALQHLDYSERERQIDEVLKTKR